MNDKSEKVLDSVVDNWRDPSDGKTSVKKKPAKKKTVKKKVAKKPATKATKKSSTKKTPPKKVVKKKAGKKAPKKETKGAGRRAASPTKEGNTLPGNQITTLKQLVKGEETRKSLRAKTKNQFLGLPALVNAGFVGTETYEGKRGHFFSITTSGKKELKKQKA